MRKASGFQPTREFTRRRGFKLTRHADAMNGREKSQGMSISGWGTGILANQPNRIDALRTAELNWKGLVAYQQSSGVYDERPRLIKKVEDALRGMK